MSGTLFVVATPIGNLDDLTPRARQTLASVDLVAAEDTRRTGRLLSTIGAKPALTALHDHNEDRASGEIIEALMNGREVALVSDAGTPLVSDPGFRLVRAAHDRGIAVVPVPGVSAVTAALSAAGLPTDRFCFEGFPPSRATARRKWLAALVNETRSIVLYESVHRIGACLADLVDAFGANRMAFVGRELTKLHEQCVRAPLGELHAGLSSGEIVGKGEFVLVVAGSKSEATAPVDADRMLALLGEKLGAKDAARITAELTGLKKNALYERVLELQKKSSS
ncbi:MAG: 16S rRNA (cytidine(1402)-2'-O)-methyltransferase [Proteobacteria bacterium]|nr:16S rRNA (cytidine(1402)-2'-O)-methyltransferase [Pseudomonadota bacterium]